MSPLGVGCCGHAVGRAQRLGSPSPAQRTAPSAVSHLAPDASRADGDHPVPGPATSRRQDQQKGRDAVTGPRVPGRRRASPGERDRVTVPLWSAGRASPSALPKPCVRQRPRWPWRAAHSRTQRVLVPGFGEHLSNRTASSSSDAEPWRSPRCTARWPPCNSKPQTSSSALTAGRPRGRRRGTQMWG